MSQTLLAFRKLAIAMLKLDKIQANKIVEKLMADIPYNINIMDERGKLLRVEILLELGSAIVAQKEPSMNEKILKFIKILL